MQVTSALEKSEIISRNSSSQSQLRNSLNGKFKSDRKEASEDNCDDNDDDDDVFTKDLSDSITSQENLEEKHTAREIVQSCIMQHFSNTRKMISVKKSSSKNTSKNNLAKKESSIKKPVKEKALQTFHFSTFDH